MANPIEKATVQDADTSRIKVPPHSLEAEQAVLGGLMLDNSKWDAVSEVIAAADFYRQDHRLIFGAIERLAGEGEPLDVVTLSEFLERAGDIEDAGGLTYLAELAEKTPGASNIKAYANIVRERAVLRRLIEVSGEIADSAFNPLGRTSDELLDEAERNVFQIAESRSKEGSGPQSINPILTKALGRIEELFESGDAITGITTGFSDLDEWTSGMQPSDLIIIAGRPSMGKTTFSMNVVENALLGSEKPALVFSMEMPADAIVMRMLSSLGRIDQTRMRSGRLEEDDWPRLTSAVSLLKDKPLYIDDTPGLSPTEMRSRARRVARENNGEIGLIMVDYLQLMRVPGNTEGRTAEISEISRSLKALAKELQCPVVALSQLNRSLEQRPNKRPVNSDLRESGAIEQDADVIMFIYRDEVYNEDTPDKGIAEIIIGKQRNGPIGTVRLAFLGKYTKFEDLAHGDYGGDY
ncbi:MULTISPECIES: replicative DNA helicase [Marinobacter]|uniref:replicative DNA helicase n=1 Tax=Marinobacter TaxID=2742 RepID=UPI000DADD96F|nr:MULTISPECIES: replicative DNA helicase [Marinobacter]